jgi:hypothetical protein
MKKPPTTIAFSLLIAALQADFDGSAIKVALARNMLLGHTKPYLRTRSRGKYVQRHS